MKSDKGINLEYLNATQNKIIEYCLTMKGSYVDFPFGLDCLIIKVKAPGQEKGRIMAQFFELKGESKVTFTCSAEAGTFYRTQYPEKVVRGYHCPLVQQPYFNTVTLDGAISDKIIKEMADHAYSAVIRKMPKYAQKELLENNTLH